MAFVLCTRWVFVLSITSSSLGDPWLHLRSSPRWVVRCWGGLLLVFWCWCVLFFSLVCRVEFLWLLCCGWFVALRSLVGGVVLLHCFHCAWLVVFVVSDVFCSRAETECDGTRKRMGGEVKGKEANGGGSQQSCTVSDTVYPALLPLMRTPRLPAAD